MEKKACPMASSTTLPSTLLKSGRNRKANPSDEPGMEKEDALQDLNIGSENKRFIYGNVHKKDIYNTKVEGKEPDEIIYFEICDKPFTFGY